MDKELKPLPCPFCGAEGAIGWFGDTEANVACETDGCPGIGGASEYMKNHGNSDIAAMRAATIVWNTRAPDPAVVALVRAARRADRMIREAFPRFNWGASALDANAIALLNETPRPLQAALAPFATITDRDDAAN